jgi:hypothetical protein
VLSMPDPIADAVRAANPYFSAESPNLMAAGVPLHSTPSLTGYITLFGRCRIFSTGIAPRRQARFRGRAPLPRLYRSPPSVDLSLIGKRFADSRLHRLFSFQSMHTGFPHSALVLCAVQVAETATATLLYDHSNGIVNLSCALQPYLINMMRIFGRKIVNKGTIYYWDCTPLADNLDGITADAIR